MHEDSTQDEKALVFRQWMLMAHDYRWKLFQEFDRKRSKNVTFGDNSKRTILWISTIGSTSQTQIKHALFVEGLKYALILMHAMSLTQIPTKLHTLEKDLILCMSFTLMKLILIMNLIWLLMM